MATTEKLSAQIEQVLGAHGCSEVDELADEQFRPIAEMLAEARRGSPVVSEEKRQKFTLTTLRRAEETSNAAARIRAMSLSELEDWDLPQVWSDLEEHRLSLRQLELLVAAVTRFEEILEIEKARLRGQN